MVNRKNKKRGQSTLEYIILVTGVLVILIYFLTGSSSPFKTALCETLATGTNGMTNMAGRLQSSRPLSP